MSKRKRKPVHADIFNHSREAQQNESSSEHLRGGSKKKQKPSQSGSELDELYNQEELNRQRNFEADEYKGN